MSFQPVTFSQGVVIQPEWLNCVQNVFNTTVDMVSVLPPQHNQVVSVLGLNTINDGAGGTFWYDLTSTATPDGIDIFAPNNDVGRWIRIGTQSAQFTVFNTIQEMRDSNLVENTTALVLGYYSPGDLGGGIFYLDTLGTAPENEGTIFEQSGAPGNWLRTDTANINLVMFGGVGDSITENTAALQQAITYCTAQQKTLYIPAGIYSISNSINVTCNIQGEDVSNTIIQAFIPLTHVIATPASNITISDITISTTNVTEFSIRTLTGTNSNNKFRRVKGSFRDTTIDGGYLFEHCELSSFIASNVGTDVEKSYLICRDCHFIATPPASGLGVQVVCPNATIDNCFFTETATQLFSTNYSITNCRFYNSSPSETRNSLTVINSGTITNCYLYSATQIPLVLNGNAISVNSCRIESVSTNTVQCFNSNEVLFVSNNIRNLSNGFEFLAFGGSKVLFANNVVSTGQYTTTSPVTAVNNILR